ncbi:MAG: MarR family transcriptional regulator [Acidobacteriota bacterium]|jgi:DNA-binding MarR family transcriptional regulator
MTTTTPTPDALTADARRLHGTLEDLIRLVQFRDRDRICCHGISVSQCYALEALASSGPLRLNELAGRLYLEKSTASRVVDGLVAKGHVERARHPEDGRAVLLAVTDGGRALYERIEGDLVAEVRALLADFEPEVRGAMTRLLGRLVEAAASRVEVDAGCCRLRRVS